MITPFSRVAAQVGHRAGALGLLLTCAGVAMMLGGKRAFVAALAAGCAAAAIGLVGGTMARPDRKGLVWFNALVLGVCVLAMVLARFGWGHFVGALAGERS